MELCLRKRRCKVFSECADECNQVFAIKRLFFMVVTSLVAGWYGDRVYVGSVGNSKKGEGEGDSFKVSVPVSVQAEGPRFMWG